VIYDSERPAIVDEELRIGDWDGRTVVSHGSRCALITLADRCSKFTLIKKIRRKIMKNANKAIICRLKSSNKPAKTIVFDNKREFAVH
jgi:IS30 family transposase